MSRFLHGAIVAGIWAQLLISLILTLIFGVVLFGLFELGEMLVYWVAQ